MIARQERISDWRRAQTLYQQLQSLRRNALQWLVPEPGPQAQECLQEFFVGILQAIDNLDPTIPAP